MTYIAATRIIDRMGESALVGPMRSLSVAIPTRVAGGVFGAAIDTRQWSATTSGTASASGVANAIATLDSGTSNNGYGRLSSVQLGRFLFAVPNQFRSSIRVPTVVVADSTRIWGSLTATAAAPQNGCYFELSAAGVLSVVTCSGATPTKVASGSFNGGIVGATGGTYTVDTNVHAYEIIYYTMSCVFLIDGEVIHKVVPTTTPLYQRLDGPLTFITLNSGTGVTSATMESWNAAIMRLGQEHTSARYVRIAGATAAVGESLKATAGNLHRITNNNKVGGTATVYDGTVAGGIVIGILDLSSQGTLEYGLAFDNGITIVTTGANTDITAIFE